MTQCIGCKCCVGHATSKRKSSGHQLAASARLKATGTWILIACTYRWVATIAWSILPDRLSTCAARQTTNAHQLTSSPMEAYTKDFTTGIVQHSADACIGYQYCTWNCSKWSAAIQFRARRGRQMRYVLWTAYTCRESACVNACPESAIASRL